MTLVELLEKNNNYTHFGYFTTDKENRHKYCSQLYDELFAPFQDKEINFLEIGIAGAGSLALWHDYFNKANVYGVDIQKHFDDSKLIDYPRVKTIIDNAYSEELVQTLPDLDIAVDDGPHNLESWINFLKLYIPKVKTGGILVIEDIDSIESVVELEKHVGDLENHFLDLRNMTGCYDNIVFVVRK